MKQRLRPPGRNSSGSLTIEGLLDRDPESGGPVKDAEVVRPKDLEKASKWKSIYPDLEVGDVVDPEKLGDSKILWYIKEKKALTMRILPQYEKIFQKALERARDGSNRKLIDELGPNTKSKSISNALKP